MRFVPTVVAFTFALDFDDHNFVAWLNILIKIQAYRFEHKIQAN